MLLQPAALILAHLLLFFSTISAREDESPFLEDIRTSELKDAASFIWLGSARTISVEGDLSRIYKPVSYELAGFIWPGAVRTISVEGDLSTCKLICSIYLDSQTKGTNTTYEIQPEIAFTGLGPGQYTISAKCREAANAYCIIEPGSVAFEVEDGYSQRMFDNINLGTLHAKVEEKEETVALCSSVFPAVIMITVLQAIGLFVISEAVKRKMAHS